MKNKSFTLIELLVVIVIIGILAGVIVVSTSSAIEKANFAKAQAFSSTVKNELFSDLVSEWTFDEDSGVTAEDTAGNNNGTIFGGPSYQNKCVYGGCYLFDGDDYIDFGDFSGKGISDPSIYGKMSVSLWVYSKGGGYQYILSSGGQTSSRGFYMDYNPTNTNFSMSIHDGAKSWYILNSFNVNIWTYITLSWDGLAMKCYKDGMLISTANGSSSVYSDTQTTFTIGRPNNTVNYFFNGFIDDVRIYNSALSSAQIKEQYLAGLDFLLSSNQISQEDYNQRINELAQN